MWFLTVFGLFLGGVLVYVVLRSLFPDYQDLPRWEEHPVSKAVQAGSATSWDPEDVRAQMGYTKGGMYAGITYIPGDSNKPWEEGKDSTFPCPACCGVMRSIYQTSDEFYDGETITYYKEVCKDCNFLNDTGRRMTEREKRAGQYVYCDVVKRETFNRTGRNCCFITTFMDEVDVATKIEDCEECPHPH